MYNMKDLYPNLGVQDTTEATLPDRDEQASLTSTNQIASPPVDQKTKMNLWLWIAVIIALVFFFGRG